jgi:hypothetical protein
VLAYSPYDPVEMPTELIALLAHFDGSPVDDVRRRVREQSGIALDDGLLRKLVDFGILIEVRDSGPFASEQSEGDPRPA